MTRCPKCGQESPDQARFCRYCGNRLTAGAAAETPDPALTSDQRAQRLLEEAFRLSEQGRVLAAIQTCQQALELNPRSTSAHSLLGTLYQRQGDRDRAIREYEQVLTLSPGSTVERRLLNELMGVPTTQQPVLVSPRVARFALTGGAAALAILAVAAFLLTRPPASPGGRRGSDLRPPGPPAPAPVGVVSDAPAFPTPGRAGLPGLPQALPSFAPAPARSSPQYQVGAAAAAPRPAGPTLIPVTGAERFYAAPGGPPAPPMAGAVEYRGTPVVASGGWGPTTSGWSPQTARDQFLQGNYARAAETYRSYLDRNPTAGGAPREELAWVYLQMGEGALASQQYEQALSSYQDDISRGHNVEAARHGLRTCQSAIRALEVR